MGEQARDLSLIVLEVVAVVRTLVGLVSWCSAKIKRLDVKPADGSTASILACLALLLPARNRERFVREAAVNEADRQRCGSVSRSCCRWRAPCRGWR